MTDAEQVTRVTLRRKAGEALHGHPDFDLAVQGLLKGAGDDADDAVRLAVEDDLLIAQVGVRVQMALPESFIDDDDAVCSRLVFAARKGAPDERRELEDLEEIRCYKTAAHAFG